MVFHSDQLREWLCQHKAKQSTLTPQQRCCQPFPTRSTSPAFIRTPRAILVLLWRRDKKGNADSWPPSNFLLSRPLLPPILLFASAKPFSHPHYLISEGSLTSILNRDPRQFLPSDNTLPNLVYMSPAFPFSLSNLCCTESRSVWFLGRHEKQSLFCLLTLSATNKKWNIEESCFKEKNYEENKTFLKKKKRC